MKELESEEKNIGRGTHRATRPFLLWRERSDTRLADGCFRSGGGRRSRLFGARLFGSTLFLGRLFGRAFFRRALFGRALLSGTLLCRLFGRALLGRLFGGLFSRALLGRLLCHALLGLRRFFRGLLRGSFCSSFLLSHLQESLCPGIRCGYEMPPWMPTEGKPVECGVQLGVGYPSPGTAFQKPTEMGLKENRNGHLILRNRYRPPHLLNPSNALKHQVL